MCLFWRALLHVFFFGGGSILERLEDALREPKWKPPLVVRPKLRQLETALHAQQSPQLTDIRMYFIRHQVSNLECIGVLFLSPEASQTILERTRASIIPPWTGVGNGPSDLKFACVQKEVGFLSATILRHHMIRLANVSGVSSSMRTFAPPKASKAPLSRCCVAAH